MLNFGKYSMCAENKGVLSMYAGFYIYSSNQLINYVFECLISSIIVFVCLIIYCQKEMCQNQHTKGEIKPQVHFQYNGVKGLKISAHSSLLSV